MMETGILAAVGNTPLVQLESLFPDHPFRLFAKLEMLNPGGSIKDRTALQMIRKAMENGEIDSRTVVVESTSGNLGIGLAQICNLLGLSFICVVDPKTTRLCRRILEAYGATVDMVREPDPETGEFLQARIDRVKELKEEYPNSYWCNQYANPDNPSAHHATMREIVASLDGKIDYLFVAVSTCGTLRGCSEQIRKEGLDTRIVAVDALGSVIFGGERRKRLIPGHGAARVPELFRENLAHGHVHVTDLDCVKGCRRLLERESILAGGSSGGVVAAIEKKSREIEEGAVCACIFPDTGERYLDTIYSDDWVSRHFGDEMEASP